MFTLAIAIDIRDIRISNGSSFRELERTGAARKFLMAPISPVFVSSSCTSFLSPFASASPTYGLDVHILREGRVDFLLLSLLRVFLFPPFS